MKSDMPSALEHLPAAREKRSINPWLLVAGTGLGFLVLIVFGLSLLAFFAPPHGPRENERLMPDGSVLRIEGMSWGTNHRLKFERPPSTSWAFWERRQTSLGRGSSQPELMVWMTRHDARSGRSLDFDWWAGSTVIDATGEPIADQNAFHWQLGNHGSSSSGGIRPFRAESKRFDTWLVGSSFTAFRTDHGRFKLQVRNTSGEIVATFDLTHPSPPVIHEWKAEELPATVKHGDVAVTLQRLRPSPSNWTDSDGAKRKSWHFSPVASVELNGSPTNDWQIALLEITDPLGNRSSSSQRNISTREPVWKVTLGAYRTANSQFTAAETWTVTDLPLPGKDVVQPLTDSRSIGGVSVTLAAIAGGGKTSYTVATPGVRKLGNYSGDFSRNHVFDSSIKGELNGTGSQAQVKIESSWPHLTLEVTGMTRLDRLQMFAKDDQGRDVPTQPVQFYGELHSYFFKTEPDAKSLTLSIIVHKGREFEFLIKPPDLSEGKSNP